MVRRCYVADEIGVMVGAAEGGEERRGEEAACLAVTLAHFGDVRRPTHQLIIRDGREFHV